MLFQDEQQAPQTPMTDDENKPADGTEAGAGDANTGSDQPAQ